MIQKTVIAQKTRLLAGAATSAVLLVLGAAPASAQTTPTSSADAVTPGSAAVQTQAAPADPKANSETGQDIVVTGTIFRRTNTETPSPVSVITAANIAARGLNTTADVIQSISAGNGGSVPQGFANGFASGAQGVSLRGLSTNSTLVLFDGLRPAYYPLADDGQRSFVDLNTIPGAIVDRVETLRDGASSTYGADAVGGVVNVILKKEIRGVSGNVEGGLSERGDAGQQRARLTAGYGSLADQGFNFYVSGEYQHQNALFANQREFPYNTKNLSSIQAGGGYTGANGNTNFLAPSTSSSSSTTAAVVRPATYTPGNIFSGVPIAGGKYQVLQQGGCAGAAQPNIAHSNVNGQYCEQDLVNQYSQILPDQTRFGGTAHLTVNVGANAQAYLTGTFYESIIFAQGTPSSLRSNNPTYTYGLVLPSTLSNGTLNPQNPYAATGQGALIFYRFGDIAQTLKNTSQTYRIAGGIDGKFGSDGSWGYTLHGTYMGTNLTQDRTGNINIAGLTTAINTGAYNFVNPSANTDAVRSLISPNQQSKAHSETAEVQGILTHAFFDLPGGPVNLGVGGEFRYENIYDPSPNPGSQFLDINAFSAVGHRYVTSGFFEVNAPVLKQLEVNVSGRYDHYSDGFNHFSPKVGAKFTPIRQFAIRGTYSEGFRAPSIPETSGNVIGFVNYTPPAAVQAAHGGNSYVGTYSLGLNSVGNPNLKPETSRSFTGGAVLQPVRWLSLTVDYYNIHKKDLIFNPADSTYANTYLAGGALPAGITITPNAADPANPGLRPTPAFVNAAYINGQSLQTSGIDGQISASVPLGHGIKLTSALEGTLVLEYKVNTGVNGVYDYLGTLGPYNTSSASGTPRWRANWQNTLEAGPYSLTATTYFTSGYKGYAADYNGVGSCDAGQTPASTYLYNGDVSRTVGGALQCTVKHFLSVDLNGSVKVNDKFTFYLIVQNLFDAHAPFDPNTYGGNNYNPAWASSGIIGRAFKGGASFKF
ncbi:TonB-dependent receptor domain-containing protein [Sphingomonas sp. PAMC 26605]|uniref:TonB-dependent receptor domain-containing protein n=1 Tax=Sphingomonas sp. PAMC 26605 TaxID=1112214 RepID=UPI00026CDE17|nr:TonB-dependent receptor [Sphingomonas sp. PAMC 26605]